MDYLKATNLSSFYGKRQVLHDVKLGIGAGEWVSIVGANGSGKTTLLKCLAGWDIKNHGDYSDGKAKITLPQRRNAISFVPTPSDLPEYLKGRELIDIIVREKQGKINPKWDDICKTLDGEIWLNNEIASLSWGTKKKLCLGVGLCVKPDFLFLDESFDGLDASASFRTRQMLLQLCHDDKIGILSASHSWESVFAYSDEIYFLQDGKIVKHLANGEFDETKQQAKDMEKIIVAAFGN
jgi:ABC-type multidrug transport system ATPase subunit